MKNNTSNTPNLPTVRDLTIELVSKALYCGDRLVRHNPYKSSEVRYSDKAEFDQLLKYLYRDGDTYQSLIQKLFDYDQEVFERDGMWVLSEDPTPEEY